MNQDIWNSVASGIVISLFFITVIMLFCVVLIRLYFNKIKNYTRLLYQKDIDFQKTLNATIIETQEQVLNNISQDLHDDAGQQLTYINFQIENLKLDSPELHLALEPISKSVGRLSQSVRSISHSLTNQLITQQNLLMAIEAELQRLQKNTLVNLVFTIKNKTKRIFSTDEKTVIYRIFQEAINNAYKHSKAKSIEIAINTLPRFEMAVCDDGKGFDYDSARQPTMGLQNMVHRAAIISYELRIKTAPGKGTIIQLSENK